jgi:hypothetical protein
MPSESRLYTVNGRMTDELEGCGRPTGGTEVIHEKPHSR